MKAATLEILCKSICLGESKGKLLSFKKNGSNYKRRFDLGASFVFTLKLNRIKAAHTSLSM